MIKAVKTKRAEVQIHNAHRVVIRGVGKYKAQYEVEILVFTKSQIQ